MIEFNYNCTRFFINFHFIIMIGEQRIHHINYYCGSDDCCCALCDKSIKCDK